MPGRRKPRAVTASVLSSRVLLLLLIGVFRPPHVADAFTFRLPHGLHRTVPLSRLYEQPRPRQPARDSRDRPEENKGYQFGDLFLNKVGRHVTGKVDYKFGDMTKAVGKSVTGKDEYQFGDISRWLDDSAKGAVNKVTGKNNYQFGDLTRYLDQRAKTSVANFTMKDEYVVGDISREVVRRATSGEYNNEDMMLLLRVLAAFGATYFTPVAACVPLQFLLKMYTCGVEMDVANRVMELLAQAVDRRFKMAIAGNNNFQIGDATKNVVMEYVGRKYEPKDKAALVDDFTKALGDQIKDKKIGTESLDKIKSMLKSPEITAELGKIDRLAGLIKKA